MNYRALLLVVLVFFVGCNAKKNVQPVSEVWQDVSVEWFDFKLSNKYELIGGYRDSFSVKGVFPLPVLGKASVFVNTTDYPYVKECVVVSVATGSNNYTGLIRYSTPDGSKMWLGSVQYAFHVGIFSAEELSSDSIIEVFQANNYIASGQSYYAVAFSRASSNRLRKIIYLIDSQMVPDGVSQKEDLEDYLLGRFKTVFKGS